MKKIDFWKNILVIVFIAFISQNLNAEQRFSAGAVKEDFKFLV